MVGTAGARFFVEFVELSGSLCWPVFEKGFLLDFVPDLMILLAVLSDSEILVQFEAGFEILLELEADFEILLEFHADCTVWEVSVVV